MNDLDQIRALRPHFDEVLVPAGELLATQGKLAHQLLVVVEGTLETCRDGVRGELVAGQSFGCASMRDRGVNEAGVRALTEARLLVMSHEQFRAVAGALGESTQPEAREWVMPAPPASIRRRWTAIHIR